MHRSMNRVISAAAVALCSGASLACTMSPPTPPPTVWTSVQDLGDGTSKVTIGQKVALFPPVITTNCACGVGIGSTALPAPGDLMPMGVRIVVVGPDDAILATLAEFAPLQSNNITSNGLAGGPGATAGASWQGYAGMIEPFVPPAIGPDSMFKMLFDIVVPNPLLGQLVGLPVQFAGGEGNTDGFPQFSGPHAVGYFAPEDNRLPPDVPAPGAAAISIASLLCFFRRRR